MKPLSLMPNIQRKANNPPFQHFNPTLPHNSLFITALPQCLISALAIQIPEPFVPNRSYSFQNEYQRICRRKPPYLPYHRSHPTHAGHFLEGHSFRLELFLRRTKNEYVKPLLFFAIS
jgi:hypothetical protein